jgi:glucokinase
MTPPAAVGIDIGGTKIAAGLVDRDGLIGDLQVVPTGAQAGGRLVLKRAIDLARSVRDRAPAGAQAAAVGIAAGGWIHSASGGVVAATDLLPGWVGLDLEAAFERELGLPGAAVNDVQAMGVAEGRLGAGRGCRVCLTVAVGTGIGGGITIDGGLLSGAHGFAGAIGHIPWRQGGPKCSCGRQGCIEAEASGPAVARAFDACLRRGPDPRASGSARSTLEDVVRAFDAQDPQIRECAARVTRTAGSRLGRVLGGLVNTLDPDVVVLGGGAAIALGDRFLAAIRAGTRESALPVMDPVIVWSRLGAAAGVVGAGLLALDRVVETVDRRIMR